MSLAKKIGFLSAFVLPVLAVWGVHSGGIGTYVGFIFAFVVLPFLDIFAGKDPHNVDESEVSKLSKDYYYRFVTYAWTFVQLGFIIWAGWIVVTMDFALYEWIGFILSLGLVTGGIGITVAHELGHKNTKIEQFYSKVILMTVSYMHFFIEHNRGHHVNVATPKDPATARFGETFYSFWVRSVFGGFKSAWHIEKKRLEKRGYPVLSLKNNMIWFTILPVLFCAVLTAGFSIATATFQWMIPVMFFAQSFVAFSLLELVNYVEHYAIQREETEPGKYERVRPIHSWNANHLISNFFLFQLQRHSDHHAYANRRYQVLRHFEESPQLPASYPTMILIALVPPLWFAIMDKKFLQWKSQYYGDKTYTEQVA